MATYTKLMTFPIIGMLREAEVQLAKGLKVKAACRQLGITEQTYYRWRKEYGGLKISQAEGSRTLSRKTSACAKPYAI